MKKAVLFDVDGTLLDAWNFIYDAVRYSLVVHKITHPTNAQIKNAMGRALVAFYQTLLPEADSTALAKTHMQFQEKYFHKLKPFPKAKRVLQKLKDKGFLLGAVSNRTKESLLRSLRLTQLLNYFDAIVTPEDVINPKPHKEHILTALNKLKVEPQNAYIVGDGEQDVLSGKAAKVKTIGVTYGFLGKDIKKLKPDYLIDDIGELLSIIKN